MLSRTLIVKDLNNKSAFIILDLNYNITHHVWMFTTEDHLAKHLSLNAQKPYVRVEGYYIILMEYQPITDYYASITKADVIDSLLTSKKFFIDNYLTPSAPRYKKYKIK